MSRAAVCEHFSRLDSETSVHPFEPCDEFAWTKYLADHPDATLFHGLAWGQAVQRTFGHRDRSLAARRDGRIVGLLPIFEIQSLLAGRLLVSQPYAASGGIVADDACAAEALLDRAKAIADEIGANALELRSLVECDRALPVLSGHAVFFRTLEVDADDAQLLPRKARAAARAAESRFGLTVEEGATNLRTAWMLYSRSMRRLASPNYPFGFFEALRDALGDRLLVQIVRRAGRAVAGLVTFLFRDRVMPYFVGIDERQNLYGLNHFIYLNLMRWAVDRGFRVFDFGRTRLDNAGVIAFKRHCGFEPIPVAYQTYVPDGRRAPDLRPGAPRWAAPRAVWSRLPLAITRPLGGWLTKSIPG